ncbi:MAG: cytochrome c biogenesis protein [Bacteroidia bacterium]
MPKSILYKIAGIALMLYGLTYGMMISLPKLPGLGQSSRNLFYHVPTWFVVMFMMGVSVYQSIRFLRMMDPDYEAKESPLIADAKASEAAHVGTLFNILGLVTGMVWSRVSWGENLPYYDFSAWWVWDPIQICALVSLMIYLAYFLLRSSFSDGEQKAKISATYNIFAFATLIPLYFIIPKMLNGLHPTSADSDAGGGSFIFRGSGGGISNEYRIILYPMMFGMIMMAYWVYEMRAKVRELEDEVQELEAVNSKQ